ncbi:MAG: hypothetical protein KKH61_21350 [Gammaproteobacteria bacterium]|uniref:Putative structural protein n=1 Tax=viral metagenome TaxID=1070528 RepID=A0A6H1ZBK7_9ZZZZ|nr:hypothetical protein [Gammaproteobacteria bacterium]
MPSFSRRSLLALSQAHPMLQQLMRAAIEKFDFVVTDSARGRVEQERAFKNGYSKARFGQSAHNYAPSIALDIYPYPIDFSPENDKKFREQLHVLQLEVIKPAAKSLGIPIRQGIDWNMNGNLTDDKWDDLPHVELHPWREFAKKSHLIAD